MPFSVKTLDFLFQNHFNDSKQWYSEHKDEFVRYVAEPCSEFIMAMQPAINRIDPKILCGPKNYSRIYRDVRFSKDKSLFREHMWCYFGLKSEGAEMPSFYFDFSPDGFSYGCGFYYAGTETMESMRELITAQDKLYLKARKAIEAQKIFKLDGELYKRNHFPTQSDYDCDWLNRRNIFAYTDSKNFDLLFSDKLAEKVSADFIAIAPFYDFLIKARNNASAKEYHN